MTDLNPAPTIFGTGAIDPLVYEPSGSTELANATLWIQNRASRYAFGAMIRIPLIGDPIAAYNLRAGFQPLLDYMNDQQLSSGYEDFDYDDPPNNWGANP